jgi:glycosyltransferase involved in cell wall biosynthesis
MNDTAPARRRSPAARQTGAEASVRLRVLHVISGLGPGGAETVLFRLATQSSGIEHEVICLGPRDWYSDRLEQRGIRVHHVDTSSTAAAAGALVKLYRLIRSSNADLVQGWMYRGNMLGGVPARFAGKPVLWNIRCSKFNLLPLPTRVLAHLGGAFARWVPKLVINCSAFSQQLHARIGYEAVEGAVIPNGYDPAAFRPDEAARAAIREKLGVAPETFLIGTIGRWDLQKGYPELLRAVRRVSDRGVPLRLLFVGRGLDSSNGELTRLIEESGTGAIVEAIGYRADIQEIARALDLHVLPSLSEGFPNVVAETMLCATPNVATDAGDAALIVDDTGWIVPPGDFEQLATAIEQAYVEWSTLPEQWQDRRTGARRHVAESFSLDRMIESYESIWLKVASKDGHTVS